MATVDDVIAIIEEQIGSGRAIAPESKFIEDLGMDSLDHVQLIMDIEDRLNIDIYDEDAEKMHTPADVAAHVDRQRGNK